MKIVRQTISLIFHMTIIKQTIVVYWPPTRPNMPFQRCRSAYSIGVGELGWQYGIGLKSHGKVTKWCTGKEWPVNCMTVMSARWWTNMPFQRRRKCIFRWPVMGRYWVGVNCYITEWTGNSISLERRCGREKQQPAESWAPGPSIWAALENGKETLMAIRVGVNMPQFCSVSNSLSRNPFK